MSFKFLTSLATILLTSKTITAYREREDPRLILMEEKLNRVLNILESTFKTHDNSNSNPHKIHSPVYYGKGKSNSGKSHPIKKSKSPIKPHSNDRYGLSKRDTSLPKIREASFKGKSKDDLNSRSQIHINAEKELEQDAYSDIDEFNANEGYKDEKAALEAYNKNDAYLKSKGNGMTYEAEYEGVRVNDSISALRRNIVREEQEINEDFFNDYTKENHEGDYNGNEFDVGYKSKQIDGGFNENKSKKEIQQSRYADATNEKELYDNGNDYLKEAYTKKDEDKRLRSHNVGIYSGRDGPNSGGKYSGNNPALYDKYTGKNVGKGGNNIKGQGNGFGYGVKRDRENKDKDIDERFHGNEFGVKDKFNSRFKGSDNVGLKESKLSEDQYNRGKYVDVEAKGFNKNANYKGDYKTNKEARKTGYKFKNLESVEEIGTPDRFASAIVNDNRVVYRGSERKSSQHDEAKYGKYTDRETKRKADQFNRNAKFQDKDVSKKLEESREDDLYVDVKKGKDIKRENFKEGYKGYRPRQKKGGYRQRRY